MHRHDQAGGRAPLVGRRRRRPRVVESNEVTTRIPTRNGV
jgi:hypothetical protein